jgi:hypothetical protein
MLTSLPFCFRLHVYTACVVRVRLSASAKYGVHPEHLRHICQIRIKWDEKPYYVVIEFARICNYCHDHFLVNTMGTVQNLYFLIQNYTR